MLNHGKELNVAGRCVVITKAQDVRAQPFAIGSGHVDGAVGIDVRCKRDLVPAVLGNRSRAAGENFN